MEALNRRGWRKVHAMTVWKDPVDNKMGNVEAICQNYEVLIKKKRNIPNKPGEETWYWRKCSEKGRNDINPNNARKRKEIDIQSSLRNRASEVRILGSRMELILWEIIEIANKELYDIIVHLMKVRRRSTTKDISRPMHMSTSVITTKGLQTKKDYIDNHYTRLH